jgi:hypothetical protein
MYNKAENITGTSTRPAYRVVRFIVQPFSINHQYEFDLDPADDIKNESFLPKVSRITNPMPSCMPGATKHTSYEMVVAPGWMPQPASGKVLFTYDVTWTEQNDIYWASRWDIYLTMGGTVQNKVHWMSIAIL